MSRLSTDDWIDAAFGALRTGGADSVRVEPIAAGLGITKGSFYWHFANRRALLDAMLLRWEKMGTDQVIDLVNSSSDDPTARLRTLIRVATSIEGSSDLIEAKLRAWAIEDPEAAAAMGRVDTKRLEFVVNLLLELGIPRRQALLRAGALYRMLIGEYTWRLAGGPVGTTALLDEIVDLMVRPV